jgi:hypothetical protein
LRAAAFGATPSKSTVAFFGSSTPPPVISWSDTSISLWVPGDPTSGLVSLQVGGLTTTSPSWFHVNAVTQLTDSRQSVELHIRCRRWKLGSHGLPRTGMRTCTVRGNGNANLVRDSLSSLSTRDRFNTSSKRIRESHEFSKDSRGKRSWTVNFDLNENFNRV